MSRRSRILRNLLQYGRPQIATLSLHFTPLHFRPPTYSDGLAVLAYCGACCNTGDSPLRYFHALAYCRACRNLNFIHFRALTYRDTSLLSHIVGQAALQAFAHWCSSQFYLLLSLHHRDTPMLPHIAGHVAISIPSTSEHCPYCDTSLPSLIAGHTTIQIAVL